jgi:hypothetical protein
MDFTNPNRIEPFFDVEAVTNVRVPGQTYRVTVAFAGTSEQLRPTLNADPPLPTSDVLALLFSDVRRTGTQDVAPELRALQNPEPDADRHHHDARDAGDHRQPLVGSRQGRRADVRRRHVPADAVVHRSRTASRRRASTRRRG